MKLTKEKIPDWISSQVEHEPNIGVNGEPTDVTSFRHLLRVCCPQIFESYAIILHPFWINWKAKELVESGLNLSEDLVYEEDFKRLSWKDFFNTFNKDFDLQSANKTRLAIQEEILKDEWPVYIWYPSEGDCETPELKYVISKIIDLFGDESVNYYYCQFKTIKWEEEIIYKGSLSEFDKLRLQKDVRDNPTAIYPKDRKWCIVSDYDLMFTYVGGTKELINQIKENKGFDIYQIEP